MTTRRSAEADSMPDSDDAIPDSRYRNAYAFP